ncbi:MAG: cyclic nucleotide-binding domain-containing protein [Deltaproteobacteria bacterium]|nr:cyclic nucleotide-binding domain-containing protein [Deltaproteobacteria bacterium]
MKLTNIIPGCVHLEHFGQSAILGAPSDILKQIIKLNLQVPSTVVLPDVSFVEGVSQVALEFLLYWHLFHNKDPEKGKFRIIGNETMCNRVKESLIVTLFGPAKEQFKKWKVSKSRTEKLLKIMDYMAIKKGDSKITLNDLTSFIYFEDYKDGELFIFEGTDCLVKHAETNQFDIIDATGKQRVDLNFSGFQQPIDIKPDDEPEIPQILKVRLLGTYSGFDADGPTTGMFMWINCNGFLVDGPVGTSEYLRQMGVPKSDITGIILSHVHDDHCTLMDMIISEQVANIITTREIYESMLIKIANVLGESIDKIRGYLKFTEVIPGKPVNMFGARWEFFYTVHSIPTIGFRVTVKDADMKDYTVVHSSDTANFSLLDKMKKAEAITSGHADFMKNLVQGDEVLVTIDGGGEPIHGNPEDFKKAVQQYRDMDILFYHVNPDNVDTSVFNVAHPGWSKTYIKGSTLPQSLVLKLLKTMNLLDIEDLTWINIIFSKGSIRYTKPGEKIVRQGSAGDDFYFILSGSAEILDKDESIKSDDTSSKPLAVLESGDFFGEMSIIKETSRNATVRSVSACVLFILSGETFMEFVESNDLKERFERLWISRAFISRVEIFKKLHPHARHQLSLMAESIDFQEGDKVLLQGGKSSDFYVITGGSVDIVKRKRDGNTISHTLYPGDFFGENVAMGYSARRNASAVAGLDGLSTLRIKGSDLRTMAEKFPVLVHELHIIMRSRGVNL